MTSTDLIIFDCDGVLIDSEGLAHQALVDTLTEYNIHMTLKEALERFMGLSEGSAQTAIESKHHIEFSPEYLAKKKRHRERLFEEQLVSIPGITELLDSLSIKKCIASGSSPERLQHSLGLVNLWDRFAPHVFSATQVKNGKPAPDLFLFAAAQMQTPPDRCLVIEDSPAGVQAAKAAHMRVYGFTGGSHCGEQHADLLRQHGAEQTFSHMTDLAEALRA